ncbi:transglutaminase family protein [Sandarakinorhabdus oryzae]|uniref:transglutaminase family protein n=1 Tax=Sandarakinorhabdus oryzae TaxID=2675220 RepID=UPI0012E291C3|nr:transglutaminase family protein [Sandarakinorhabdus oryzae]
MRIRVDYSTVYEYAQPASNVLQLLRVQPAGHEGQHVVNWRIDSDCDGHLKRGEDAFGNITHMFYPDGLIQRLALHVSGEVDTQESHGVLAGTFEPLPAMAFLRQSELTRPDDALLALARQIDAGDALASCHRLTGLLYDGMTFDADVTHSHSDAAHAFAIKAGVCQDYAHIFLSVARSIGIPARYVSGHLVRQDGLITQPAAHAWAEALIPDLGWVAFDPTNGMCATEAYLRVAVGLDYRDAAPIRGARRGGGTETMNVAVTTQASGQASGRHPGLGELGQQTQEQSQS